MAVDFLFSLEPEKHNGLETYLGCKVPFLNKTNLDFVISNNEIKIIENIYADDFELFHSL